MKRKGGIPPLHLPSIQIQTVEIRQVTFRTIPERPREHLTRLNLERAALHEMQRDSDQQLVRQWLSLHPDSTKSEISKGTGMRPDRVMQALRNLRRQGLIRSQSRLVWKVT